MRAQARVPLGQSRDAYADAETAAILVHEPWTEGLRIVTEVGAGNRDAAASLLRALVPRYLAPYQELTVQDATMLALGFVRMGDINRGTEVMRRARPRGRLLVTALRNPAFEAIRQDTAFAEVLRLTHSRDAQY